MIGIAAVVAYTIFSGFQMHYAGQQRDAANETLRTTKEQFQFDQRPHVAMAGIGIMDFQTRASEFLFLSWLIGISPELLYLAE